MLDRRTIRVLTTFSKTFSLLTKALSVAPLTIFLWSLNVALTKAREGEKLKHRHLKVRIIFVPVARDQLISALNAGKGDIIAANLTITPARQQEMTFTAPIYSHVQELLLSGPGSPKWKICSSFPVKRSLCAPHQAITRALLRSTRALRSNLCPHHPHTGARSAGG